MAGYFEKTKSGKYRLFASGGSGSSGKRKRFTKTVEAKSDREADKLLAKFVADVEKGTYIEPTKLTLEGFVERWLRDYGEQNLAPKTLYRYKQILNSRILPALGHMKVESIKPMHLLSFYTNLNEEGIRSDGKPGKLSEKTILYHHRILSSIFSDAVEWQIIDSNPAARVKPPRVKAKQAACYDEDQTLALMEALETVELKYKTAVILAVATGLRRGELMGLEWEDIDFNKGTLEVRQAGQYLPGKGTFTKAPKNETSKRIIAVSASVLALLRKHKARQAEERLEVGDIWRGSGVLSDFTELFDAVAPKGVFGAQLLKSYSKQREVLEKSEENIQAIADRANNDQFIQELRKFGANAALEIAALSTLLEEQLQEYISLYQAKKKNSRGGRVFTTWDGRPMHPDTLSSWFPRFIRTYNIREAFNAEISAVSNKLSAQDLAALEDLKEQYIKLNSTKLKALKEKLAAAEDSIIKAIGQEGFERIKQGQKLPPLPFHGLRHTSITMLIAQGIPLPNVSRRAGHANTTTTANIYAHALKSIDREAADKLDLILTGNDKGKEQSKKQA